MAMIRLQKAHVLVLPLIYVLRAVYFLQPMSGHWDNSEKRLGQPLAILFTSFSNQSDKLFVYNNTIMNWASFAPSIQPVLLTTFQHGPVIELATRHGWHVLDNPRVNQYGVPVLKDMYRAAMQKYNTTLYGFANGDILFDNGLRETLEKLVETLPRFRKTPLLFGIRSNYELQPQEVYTEHPLWHQQTVHTLAKTNATLFRHDAFDYFFVTRKYPFERFKRLVISRTGFDTYFVAISNQFHLPTIDGTATISALHQTDKYGNWHSKGNDPDKRFNRKLIGPAFHYGQGHVSQARYGSHRDEHGTVFFKCRKCEDARDLH